MSLTPEEQRELAELENEVGGSLSADEQAELSRLEKELSDDEYFRDSALDTSSDLEKTARFARDIAVDTPAGAVDALTGGFVAFPESQKRSPYLYGGGMIGGGLAGGAAARALPLVGPALKTRPGMLAEGGLFGAAQGWNKSPEGASTDEKLENAFTGGTVGSLIPAGLGVAGSAANKVAPALKDLRNYFGLKSVGGTASQMGKTIRDRDVTRMIDRALSDRVIRPFKSSKSIYDDLVGKEAGAGARIGHFLDRADEAKLKVDFQNPKMPEQNISKEALFGGPFEPQKPFSSRGQLDLDYIMSLLDESAKKDRSLAPSMPSVKSYLEDMATVDGLDQTVSLNKIREMKSGLGEKGYSLARQLDSPGQRAFQAAERDLANVIKADVGEMSKTGALGPDALKEYGKLNDAYSDYTTMKQMSAGQVGRDASRMPVGLVDTLGGGFGAVSGGILSGGMGTGLGAIAGVGLSRGARAYGNQIGTVVSDKLSKLASGKLISPKYQQILKQAQSRGPTEAAIANYVLYDTDEQYRREVDAAEKKLEEEGPR
jgi:hypothetical protein